MQMSTSDMKPPIVPIKKHLTLLDRAAKKAEKAAKKAAKDSEKDAKKSAKVVEKGTPATTSTSSDVAANEMEVDSEVLETASAVQSAATSNSSVEASEQMEVVSEVPISKRATVVSDIVNVLYCLKGDADQNEANIFNSRAQSIDIEIAALNEKLLSQGGVTLQDTIASTDLIRDLLDLGGEDADQEGIEIACELIDVLSEIEKELTAIPDVSDDTNLYKKTAKIPKNVPNLPLRLLIHLQDKLMLPTC